MASSWTTTQVRQAFDWLKETVPRATLHAISSQHEIPHATAVELTLVFEVMLEL